MTNMIITKWKIIALITSIVKWIACKIIFLQFFTGHWSKVSSCDLWASWCTQNFLFGQEKHTCVALRFILQSKNEHLFMFLFNCISTNNCFNKSNVFFIPMSCLFYSLLTRYYEEVFTVNFLSCLIFLKHRFCNYYVYLTFIPAQLKIIHGKEKIKSFILFNKKIFSIFIIPNKNFFFIFS
jgi:hypothetical protein